jgi:hypothetical protein
LIIKFRSNAFVIFKKSTNKFTLLYTETCKNPYLSLHEYNIYIYQICIKIRKLKPLLLKKSIKNTQIDNMTSVEKIHRLYTN